MVSCCGVKLCMLSSIFKVAQTESSLKPKIGRRKANIPEQLICISKSLLTVQTTQIQWPMLGRRYVVCSRSGQTSSQVGRKKLLNLDK